MAKSYASSVRGGRAAKSGVVTRQRKIDFSDIPELSNTQLASMHRIGRPPQGDLPRKLVSIRLNQRVLAWLKECAAEKERPYQSLINDILERAMRRAG